MDKIFGKENAPFLELMFKVREGIPQRKYQFMSQDAFEKLLYEDTKLANKQYTVEIFERIHLASALSILRNLKWYEAVDQAYANKNYLAFASALRGLIESTGDTLYSLRNMSITLAENFVLFLEVLEGKKEELVVSKDIEDLLIHFTHGRGIKKGEEAEESHNMRRPTVYVKQLEELMQGYLEFYSTLCQIVHPAKDSVFAFLNEKNHSIRITKENDRESMNLLIRDYKEIIEYLPQASFNPVLLNLKTLNFFPYINTRTLALNSVNLDAIPGWKRIEATISREVI